MILQFWFLWLFIALIVVLVAFTLRKESEEMPRKEILRAVEASTKMGLAEKLFLWVFSWLDTRFRIQDYWAMSRDAYHSMHRQMPMTHAEKYKLRIIWYWYPLYCLGGISFLAFILSDIMGDEDHSGDMDFKVAGGYEGVTALQMDIKISGITEEILKKALYQAKNEGRDRVVAFDGSKAESGSSTRFDG